MTPELLLVVVITRRTGMAVLPVYGALDCLIAILCPQHVVLRIVGHRD